MLFILIVSDSRGKGNDTVTVFIFFMEIAVFINVTSILSGLIDQHLNLRANSWLSL